MSPTDDDKEPERKERVIHTRVPAVLERELKRLAQSLRVPVSNVVRTILEDAVSAVDNVGRRAEGELRTVADRLHKSRAELVALAAASAPDAPAAPGAEPQVADAAAAAPTPEAADALPAAAAPAEPEATPDPLAAVVGFQPLLIARPSRCARCGRELLAGSEAYLGIRDDGGPRVVLGAECLPFSGR